MPTTTLVDRFRAQAARYGTTRRYTFVRETREGTVDDVDTFADLDRRARQIAVRLRQDVGVGERILLLQPDGFDFLEAFLGCLYAGVIAVPAPVSRYKRSIDRLANILVDADITTVATTTDAVEPITEQLAELGLSRQVTSCIATDATTGIDADAWVDPGVGPDSVAYLQYTSGSTSEPKGVVVTHDNLVHNIEVIGEMWVMTDASTMVGWLPHFHDMGLIGMLLSPLYHGGNCGYCAPLSFVKRPVRWMEMVTRFRGTATAAPDFAYDLCARSVTDEQLTTLDVSTLVAASNGAEPVRPATLELFAKRFAPAGFRSEAATPSYGLAEATLGVASGHVGGSATIRELDVEALERNEIVLAEAGAGVRLSGHGRPMGCDLRIVDPQTGEEQPEARVGEIWVGGRSVAAGYWDRPRATAETFEARTTAGDGPFLRTGDLGFLLDGELFVTGRLKDLIVVQGRNIYPQDVEHTVRGVHPALATRPGVAFSVDTGREHLVVVQEIKASSVPAAELPELTARIRQAIVAAFDVPFPSVVVVDRPVPRTTSGKVQRSSTRAQLLAGELTPLFADLEPALCRLIETGVIEDVPC